MVMNKTLKAGTYFMGPSTLSLPFNLKLKVKLMFQILKSFNLYAFYALIVCKVNN